MQVVEAVVADATHKLVHSTGDLGTHPYHVGQECGEIPTVDAKNFEGHASSPNSDQYILLKFNQNLVLYSTSTKPSNMPL